MMPYSLYLHIPFCVHRCAYCDFNTYAGMDKKIPAYVDALCNEIRRVAQATDQPVVAHSVFFGGGTPTMLPVKSIGDILDCVRASFVLTPEAEITIEANPGTVSQSYLETLRSQGVNRISLGMQSADEGELIWLTRQHKFIDVENAVTWARKAGFDNLSLDLIFGLPSQRIETWQHSVEKALELDPQHLSLYSLIVEPETPLQRWVERGLVEAPDDDTAAEMYEWSMDRLEQAGFFQYEISNWARSDLSGKLYASTHNLQYWLNQPYLGFGAGAHGYAGQLRTANVKPISGYIQRINSWDELLEFPRSNANETLVQVDVEDEIAETMMVGLRLTQQGVGAEQFRARFGQTLTDTFSRQISKLTAEGLLEWAGDNLSALRLTRRGRLFGNRVFREFI